MAGDKLIYCNGDHFSIIQALQNYDKENIVDLNILYFNNDDNDELNNDFREWINDLESNCYKLVKKLRNKNNKSNRPS